MISAETLLIFAPAALALNLTPGNDMLFCLGQGMKSGPRAGIAASLGITCGGIIHTLAAALGLAALLASHPGAFEVIRWAGVAYLVWLAIKAFTSPGVALGTEGARRETPGAAFRQAVVVNLTNPKIVVFVLAFLPQFVDPARGSPFVQFLLLGAILNGGGMVINGLVGGFAGALRSRLTSRIDLARYAQRVTGLIFLGLAARIAFERR
ncbi:LysE family translocator [Ancylobacter pratisalsi]|uniref:LysE family translocator n=1 Tax=Ancylobacter pratisalsi TaxID=1745854 RepID=A0A6P1YGQ2_9HYPH|nr:LysE family translocator [Ancylobacter pratisalsi]QIB32459.1 LysE family translocator [Ancylobacter pratisalsi]